MADTTKGIASLCEYTTEGHLRIRNDYPRTYESAEPICPVCNEPIRFCLDMASFTTGSEHRLAHAHCVWTPEAFDREKREAKKRGN